MISHKWRTRLNFFVELNLGSSSGKDHLATTGGNGGTGEPTTSITPPLPTTLEALFGQKLHGHQRYRRGQLGRHNVNTINCCEATIKTTASSSSASFSSTPWWQEVPKVYIVTCQRPRRLFTGNRIFRAMPPLNSHAAKWLVSYFG